MGYPMNYGRVIGRNRLTGDYDPAEHTGLGLIRGDLRRLEKDQQDDAHVAAYARRAGTTFAQAKQILADVFCAQDVLWQPAPNNPEVAAAPEGGWHKAGEYEYVGPSQSVTLEAGERAYICYRPTGRWFIVLPDSGLGMNSGSIK
jgi:hypothetical protein